MTLNLKSPPGRELLLELVKQADVLVENYKVGTLAKYGLDYASLAAINPGLIYLSVTGFGQSGPFAHKPGYDYIFQGMGGLMSYTGIADGEPGAGPLRTGVAVVDLMTGMYATSAVLAALVQRARTGRGQHLDIALLDVAVAMNANQASNYLVSGESPARIGNTHPNLAPYEVFACADGHVILAIGNDTQFVAFCRLMGADWHLQPDFATNAGRLTHLKRLRPLLRGKLAAWRVEALGRALDEHGISWGNVNDMEQVFAHPQVRHRQMLQTVDHPQLGTLRLVRNPMVPAGRDAPATSGEGPHARQSPGSAIGCEQPKSATLPPCIGVGYGRPVRRTSIAGDLSHHERRRHPNARPGRSHLPAPARCDLPRGDGPRLGAGRALASALARSGRAPDRRGQDPAPRWLRLGIRSL